MQGGGGGSAAAAPAGEAAGPAPAVEHRPTELGSVGLLPEPAADVAPTAEDGAPPAGAAAAAPTAEGEQAATDAGAAAAPAPQPAVQEKTGAGQRRRESCMAPMTAATAAWQAAPRSLRSRRPPTSLRLCPLVPPPPPPARHPPPPGKCVSIVTRRWPSPQRRPKTWTWCGTCVAVSALPLLCLLCVLCLSGCGVGPEEARAGLQRRPSSLPYSGCCACACLPSCCPRRPALTACPFTWPPYIFITQWRSAVPTVWPSLAAPQPSGAMQQPQSERRCRPRPSGRPTLLPCPAACTCACLRPSACMPGLTVVADGCCPPEDALHV